MKVLNKAKIMFALIIIMALLTCVSCSKCSEAKELLGVWWWDSSLDDELYLSLACKNNVTEIYYCDSRFNEHTSNFIMKANQKNIKVYFLAGEYEWLEDDSQLHSQINKYLAFQAKSNYHFDGIHLDIEPHQSPNFSVKRQSLLEKLVTLVYNLSQTYKDIKFAYDIPFWIEDEIEFNGEILPAYAHIIKYADKTFIMSYRDTMEAIYDVSKSEIEYANSINKSLVLCVETYSKEGDNVSFMEEGKAYMNGEIKKLKEQLPQNYGIAIHHIKTWYNLKD